jgi:hypothetical protein
MNDTGASCARSAKVAEAAPFKTDCGEPALIAGGMGFPAGAVAGALPETIVGFGVVVKLTPCADANDLCRTNCSRSCSIVLAAQAAQGGMLLRTC